MNSVSTVAGIRKIPATPAVIGSNLKAHEHVHLAGPGYNILIIRHDDPPGQKSLQTRYATAIRKLVAGRWRKAPTRTRRLFPKCPVGLSADSMHQLQCVVGVNCPGNGNWVWVLNETRDIVLRMTSTDTVLCVIRRGTPVCIRNALAV